MTKASRVEKVRHSSLWQLWMGFWHLALRHPVWSRGLYLDSMPFERQKTKKLKELSALAVNRRSNSFNFFFLFVPLIQCHCFICGRDDTHKKKNYYNFSLQFNIIIEALIIVWLYAPIFLTFFSYHFLLRFTLSLSIFAVWLELLLPAQGEKSADHSMNI